MKKVPLMKISEYNKCLNLNNDGMMGYISIPKIDVKLPIYHSTDNEVLQKYVGHLEGSSLPVGGKSTHGVWRLTGGCPAPDCLRIWTELKRETGFIFMCLIRF